MAGKKDTGIREASRNAGKDEKPAEQTSESISVPPVNPELEKKLKETAVKIEGEVKKGRGRPAGSTNKKVVEAERPPLPTEANPVYTGFLMAIFKLLAKKMKSPEMEIDTFEAETVSLPLTQIIAFHFPGTSPIVLAYIQLGMAVTVLSMSKIPVISKWKEEQEKKHIEKKPVDTQAQPEVVKQ